MSTTLLLLCLLVSFSFLVAAAPQRGLIGPQKFSEEESDMISAVTTCQTAILRYNYVNHLIVELICCAWMKRDLISLYEHEQWTRMIIFGDEYGIFLLFVWKKILLGVVPPTHLLQMLPGGKCPSKSDFNHLHNWTWTATLHNIVSRCFEKNSCGGLFVVHSNDTRTNIALGACAFLSKVQTFKAQYSESAFYMQVKDLIDEEDNVDSLVSERNVGRPKLDSEDTNGNLDESSQTTHSLESEEDLSKNQAQLDKIFRNPPTTNRLPFASKGCLGGSHERCIKDAEEGGCGALEQFDLQSYIKCVHHCVEHCKTEAENLVERK